jgi:hypothetical protein
MPLTQLTDLAQIILTGIREMLASNLAQDTGYPD